MCSLQIQKLKSVTSSGDTTADTDDKPEAIASGTKVVIAKPVTMKRQTSKDEVGYTLKPFKVEFNSLVKVMQL